MQTTTIHREAIELAGLLRPLWAEKLHALRASGIPLNLDGDPALMPRVREQNTKATQARARSRELCTTFETARDSLAASAAVTDPESAEFKAAEAAHDAWKDADKIATEAESLRDRLLNMVTDAAPDGSGNGPQDGDSLTPEQTRALSKSAGEIALRSDSYKALQSSGAFTVNERKSVDVVLVHRTDRARDEMASAMRQTINALVTGADQLSGGALIEPTRGPLVPLPVRELRLIDLITIGTTDSDSVKFPVVTGFSNNAAEVAEATGVDGTSGTKPLSDLDLDVRTFDVVNIAHAIAATKRSLADAGQIRTLIELLLRQGLDERLDNEIADGNGQGENIRGILNTAGIAQVARRKAETGNTNTPEIVLDTIFRAKTTVRKSRYRPNGVGMSEDDWAEIVLSREGKQPVDNQVGTAGSYAEGGYFMGGPVDIPNQRIWGMPVILSEAFPVGGPLVGDYSKAVLWLREATQILASDSHMDFFLRNLVAILAEFRAAFGVIAPAAFCQADIT